MVQTCDVMVITPHPDDSEFGTAGTIAKWASEGKVVVYVVCTNGNKGSSDPEMTPQKLAEIREAEQRCAAELLGVREVVFLRHDDQTLEDTAEFRKEIVRLLRMYRPATVITSDPYRRYIWHRDHRIAGQVVLDAIFPYARDRMSYLDLIEEGLEPHKVGEVLLWAADDPNYRSDITDTFKVKMAALRCHKSQIEAHSVEIEEWLKQRAKEMAQGEDFELAEAFHQVLILW